MNRTSMKWAIVAVLAGAAESASGCAVSSSDDIAEMSASVDNADPSEKTIAPFPILTAMPATTAPDAGASGDAAPAWWCTCRGADNIGRPMDRQCAPSPDAYGTVAWVVRHTNDAGVGVSGCQRQDPTCSGGCVVSNANGPIGSGVLVIAP